VIFDSDKMFFNVLMYEYGTRIFDFSNFLCTCMFDFDEKMQISATSSTLLSRAVPTRAVDKPMGYENLVV